MFSAGDENSVRLIGPNSELIRGPKAQIISKDRMSPVVAHRDRDAGALTLRPLSGRSGLLS